MILSLMYINNIFIFYLWVYTIFSTQYIVYKYNIIQIDIRFLTRIKSTGTGILYVLFSALSTSENVTQLSQIMKRNMNDRTVATINILDYKFNIRNLLYLYAYS